MIYFNPHRQYQISLEKQERIHKIKQEKRKIKEELKNPEKSSNSPPKFYKVASRHLNESLFKSIGTQIGISNCEKATDTDDLSVKSPKINLNKRSLSNQHIRGDSFRNRKLHTIYENESQPYNSYKHSFRDISIMEHKKVPSERLKRIKDFINNRVKVDFQPLPSINKSLEVSKASNLLDEKRLNRIKRINISNIEENIY